MPTYEYKCRDCGQVFTMQQSIFARKKNETCPSCGGQNTERLISKFNSKTDDCGPSGYNGPFC